MWAWCGSGRAADSGRKARRAAAVWPLHSHAVAQPPCADELHGRLFSAPLRPPVRASEYKKGQSHTLHVARGGRTPFIVGSAGFEPGVLLGAGRGDAAGHWSPWPDSYRDALWTEVIAAVGARRVIPIHWHDFCQSPGQPVVLMWPLLDDCDASIGYLRDRGARDSVNVRLPLEWQVMDAWRGLPVRR